MPAPETSPLIRVVAALIEQEQRYLVTQRRPEAVLPLLWEFPGGRVESGETDQDALRREVQHRLGVAVLVGPLISFVHHAYARYRVDLFLYQCSLGEAAEVRAHNVHAFAWLRSTEFENYHFTPADEQSVSLLLGLPDLDI